MKMILETTILLEGLVFPESPRWHDAKLWFSDIYDHKVMTVDIAGHSETVVTLPGWPSGLGWLPNNRLVIVSIMERALLQLDPERLVNLADLRNLESGGCNDMVVSQQGWVYIGTMGFNPFADEPYAQGKIILVTLDSTARVVADQLEFPNGMVITPDGHTLIVAETSGECLTAFDITSDGSLVNRHIWAQIKGYTPDGICLDAEGAIWVAAFGSTDVLRVCEGGAITHRARVANTPLACMLGGVDRHTLFVATTATNQPDDAIARRSGRIETVRVEVASAGLP
jgi:sugar lactone lactonase YvrE